MTELSPILRSRPGGHLSFWCPGCNGSHAIQHGEGSGPRWTWNGSADKPTFTPSVKCTWSEPSDDPDEFDDRSKDVPQCCHSFVRDGMIEFLGDCTHHLAGKTVPLGTFPPNWG